MVYAIWAVTECIGNTKQQSNYPVTTQMHAYTIFVKSKDVHQFSYPPSIIQPLQFYKYMGNFLVSAIKDKTPECW